MPRHGRRVICLQDAQIYDSLTIAAGSVPAASPAGIQRCCTGERNFSGGRSWRYLDDIVGRYSGQLTLREMCDRELAAIALQVVYNGGVK